MCFSEYPGGAVLLSNTDQAVLLPPSGVPLRVAGRTRLARSDALWGAVATVVDHVELRDGARPRGIAVTLSTAAPKIRVFVAPVATGPATIAAFDSDNEVVQVVRQD